MRLFILKFSLLLHLLVFTSAFILPEGGGKSPYISRLKLNFKQNKIPIQLDYKLVYALNFCWSLNGVFL